MKKFQINDLTYLLFCLIFFVGISVPVAAKQDDRSIQRMGQTKERRIALVIGNSAYKQSPLKNPVNDAGDIAAALEKNGFQVQLLKNSDQRQMEDAIRAFGKRLYGGGVGLFYFAGHGVQYHGRNYLVPVKARIEDESDVKYEAVDAGKVLGKMELAGNDVNIVILDACRNNPFSRSFRSAKQGLAQMDAPTGSFLAYATSPGSVAADGKGRNGVYTKYLLKYMGQPEQSINKLFMKVRRGVLQETGQKQTPWESSSLTGDFYFGGVAIQEGDPSPQDGSSDFQARLEVTANIDGARVFVNGKEVGSTPLSSVSVSSGEGSLTIKKPGYQSYQKRVRFEPGRTLSLYIDLTSARSLNGRLYVDTEPADARIRILNIVPRFYQGMVLEEKNYQVEVSAAGYEKKIMWVSLKAGADKRLDVRLNPFKAGYSQPLPLKGKLYVDTQPPKAMVKIVNFDTRFYQGIELKADNYKVEVSAQGYQKKTKWVALEGGREKRLEIRLDLLKANRSIPLPMKGKLYIDTQPPRTRIKIMNLRTRFSQGIELKADNYQVEVSARGYEKKRVSVTIEGGKEKRLDIRLNPLQATRGKPLPKRVFNKVKGVFSNIWDTGNQEEKQKPSGADWSPED